MISQNVLRSVKMINYQGRSVNAKILHIYVETNAKLCKFGIRRIKRQIYIFCFEFKIELTYFALSLP